MPWLARFSGGFCGHDGLSQDPAGKSLMTDDKFSMANFQSFQFRKTFPQWKNAQKNEMRPARNKKPLPDLTVKQGQIGGWEFARLSFPG
jgi:hypothetical protein